MKVRYSGPCTTGLFVVALERDVAHGEAVDVPDDLAAALLEQDGWEVVTDTKTREG
jgi:hypothetical protein